MTQVADAFIRYLAETKDLEKAIGPNGPVAASAERGAKSAGSRFKTAFTAATTGIGVAGGALFTTAIEGATALEDQMRTVNTVAGLSDTALANLTDDVQALSRETGKSTDELTAGLYDLVSAGVPADQAINVLRDSAKLAVGALGTTGESVDAVTSALNAYGLGASESTKVTDILAKAVADGKVTISEIGASIANIAPIAASAGISLEEVSAGYAQLTAKGVPAAQAATQMRAAISALLTPNTQLNKVQEETGINFAKLAETEGLSVALQKLRESVGGNDEAFAKALGSVEAYQFALQSTQGPSKYAADLGNLEKAAGKVSEKIKAGTADVGDMTDTFTEFGNNLGIPAEKMEEFAKIAAEEGIPAAMAAIKKELGEGEGAFDSFQAQIQETMDASGVATAQYEEKSKSALEQGKKLLANVMTFAQDVGGPFVSTVGPGIFMLNELGRAFGIPIAPAKLLGSVIGGIGGRLIAGITGLIPAITPALSAVGAAIPTIISAAMALWPLLLIAAIVAGIIFLINNPEIVEKLKTFAGEVLTNISNFLGALPGLLGDIFRNALGFAADVVRNVLGAIVRYFLELPGRVWRGLVKIGTFFLQIKERAGRAILELVGNVARFVLSIPGRIASFVGSVVKHFLALGVKVTQTVTNIVSGVVRFFLSIPGKLVSLGVQIVTNIIRGLASLPGRLADAIRNAFRSLRIDIGPFHISASGVRIDLPDIKLPSFDVGSTFIPADMLAMVHRGEIIIPADEAEAIRQGRGYLGKGKIVGPSGASGAPVTIEVHTHGLPMRAETPLEVARQARRVVAGVIDPYRAPAWSTVGAK